MPRLPTIVDGHSIISQASSGDLAEEVIATPVIAGNRIYVRTGGTLYCFGEKKSLSAP